MKHRIDGDTIVLELDRTELQSLIGGGFRSRIDFGDFLREAAEEYDQHSTGAHPIPPRRRD